MDTRISHAQILVAHAFARALRHRWAYHVDPDRVGVTTPAEIRDLVAAADDPDHPCVPPGIVCPALDDGDIVHTSASGTVAWRVPWVGLATLAVRPWTGSTFAAEAIARLLVAVSGLARRGVLVDVVIDRRRGAPRLRACRDGSAQDGDPMISIGEDTCARPVAGSASTSPATPSGRPLRGRRRQRQIATDAQVTRFICASVAFLVGGG